MIFLLGYLFIGIWLTVNSQSRGIWADLLFTLFWPLYWFDDWRNGRL